MAKTPEDARMRELEDRIAALKKTQEPEPREDEHYTMVQLGWRMVIELVAGIVIGAGLGYGLDVLLGTLPIFLVVMTLLGFAAGVRTMMRTAGEVQQEQAAHAARRKED